MILQRPIEIRSVPGIVKDMLRHLLLLFATLLALPLAAQDDKGQPREVSKLDGTKILGIVEITDDYTIRISSDSGLQKIPIALLSQEDFEKYSGATDRSQDGRLWSERKHALEDSQSKGQEKPADIEIRLGEIAAFQPLIDAYEKTLADKKSTASAQESPTPSQTASPIEPMQSLFSGPGTTLGGVPGAETIGSTITPAVSAGAGAVQTLAPTAP
ncbi:MAG: hypothetical protein J0I10_15550 [Verrucomicrobia bacterium]|nr:hypothetical protein [Verrucomicrobiota bacterium]